MKTLNELVQEVPLYWRVAPDPALSKRRVALYCSAEEVEQAVTHFRQRYSREPALLCYHDGLAERFTGIPEIKIEELAVRSDVLILVYGKKDRAKGIRLALNGVREFVFAVSPEYKDIRYQPDYLKNHSDQLERVLRMLEDEESRMTFASVIKQRIRGEHGYMRIARYPEYSHPLVRTLSGDVVVDAGAFDGSTSIRFARQSGSGKVFAFEPDPGNQGRIERFLRGAAKSNDKDKRRAAANVEIVPMALYSEEKTLRFAVNKLASSAISTSTTIDTVEVQAIPLDIYVERNGIKRIDLVSLDVEGAESAVLSGMRSVIEKMRPKLQVSIYHNKADLFELPLMLSSMCENYRFFMGHHNTYSTETDLYAMPR